MGTHILFTLHILVTRSKILLKCFSFGGKDEPSSSAADRNKMGRAWLECSTNVRKQAKCGRGAIWQLFLDERKWRKKGCRFKLQKNRFGMAQSGGEQ